MNCDDFERSLHGGVGHADRSHARTCGRCARHLALVVALSDLAPMPAPESLDRRVRDSLPKVRTALRRRSRLVLATRIAAAVLVLAVGFTVASDQRSGPAPARIDLQVVKMPAESSADEDVAIEEIYGPATPVLDPGGGASDAAGRR